MDVLTHAEAQVAVRQHADHAALLDDRDVAVALLHAEFDRVLEELVGVERVDVRRHHLRDRDRVVLGEVGRKLLVAEGLQQVRLRHDAGELLAVHDRDGADALAHDQARDVFRRVEVN